MHRCEQYEVEAHSSQHFCWSPTIVIAHNGHDDDDELHIFFCIFFCVSLLADMFKMAIEPRDFIPP